MDPLSLAASVVGIATFADTIVTRLWDYCKAAKNYDEEVRLLLKETKLLCIVLESLEEIVHEEGSSDVSAIPASIAGCNHVLSELSAVLAPFRSSALTGRASAGKRLKQGKLGGLLKMDFQWPLAKSKTAELIERLSRYKDTFALALVADQFSTIKEILDTAELSKKELAEVKSDTNKLVQVQQSKEMKECLEWLAPVNAAQKHQEFRNEYQEGTGKWIFERPEYQKWLNSTNGGLWIHAIPGAGKTILASLIIETLSKELPPGTAYYYCRHSDPTSQKPQNVLGSLVSQLARQHDSAYKDAYALYCEHHPLRSSPTDPTEEELGKLIQKQAKHFQQLNLVIDGLDEVGASLSVNRSGLIEILSTLNHSSCKIRTIIVSRDESDIRELLADFNAVSVAATSEDLQLYVSAKMHQLQIEDPGLRSEVFQALVDGAEGMFFWTVCQIQLIADLPNSRSIRQALRNLPPGLPATYTRIFERIDTKWPEDTKRLIHRTLKWLVLGKDTVLEASHGCKVNLDGLLHAISVEDGITLDAEAVPSRAAPRKWLGCLVRITENDTLEIAHYSVREFLLDTESPTSKTVSRYLVRPEMELEMAETCFSYLALSNFDSYSFNLFDGDALLRFKRKYPFYSHAAGSVDDYLQYWPSDWEPTAAKQLLANPPPKSFFFWIAFASTSWNLIYDTRTDVKHWTPLEAHGDISGRVTPLHVACEMHMPTTVSRLLDEGADLNAQFANDGTPLHRLLNCHLFHLTHIGFERVMKLDNTYDDIINNPRKVPIIRSLIDRCCDVNRTATWEMGFENPLTDKVSPLYIAIAGGDITMAEILVEHEACILCSMDSLDYLIDNKPIYNDPRWKKLIQKIIEYHTDTHVCDILEDMIRDDIVDEGSLSKVPGDENSDSGSIESQNLPLTEYLRAQWKQTYEIDGFRAALFAGKLDYAEYYVSIGADLNAITEHDFKQMIISAISQRKAETLSYVISKAEATGKLKSISAEMQASDEHATEDFESLRILLSWKLLSKHGQDRLFVMSCAHQDKILMESLFESYQDFDPLSLSCLQCLAYVDLPWKDIRRHCCICWAIGLDSIDFLKIILRRKSKLQLIPAHGHINLAIRYHKLEALKLILQYGENPNTPDENRCFPVHTAAQIHIDNYQKSFSNIEEADEDTEKDRAQSFGSASLLVLLQQFGADLATTSRGANALHHAMYFKNLENVKYLVAHGVDLHAIDANGERPIHAACRAGFEVGIDFILRRPDSTRSLDKESNFGTPLYAAASNGHVEIVRKLLDAGVNINSQALPGNTLGPALYVACAIGNLDVIQLLLSRGADTDVRGPRYHSAMAVAKAFDQIDVIEIIQKYKAGQAGEDKEAK
ncbi:hypothetical protein BP6252_01715 [Coleophoma cylindrospora]|uniref:NACHT domain-containing protein n=1 Tax=Coleophoma cylindrospora TaxID=1849047 RepID=A0A3D8STP0_9HELO|nr:hypothetical protein BP6252_01715 [Coleophoma cylindrospora]